MISAGVFSTHRCGPSKRTLPNPAGSTYFDTMQVGNFESVHKEGRLRPALVTREHMDHLRASSALLRSAVSGDTGILRKR